LRVHYRVPLNFTWQGMNEAHESLARIEEWLARLREVAEKANAEGPTSNVQRLTTAFEDALDDDLNISAALGFLFESIRETNRAMDHKEIDAATANAWLHWWERVNTVLALPEQFTLMGGPGRFTVVGADAHMIDIPAEVTKLKEERENARREKNWKRSDELRERISALGWEVRDTKDGPKLTRGARSP